MKRLKKFLKNNSLYFILGLSFVGIFDTSYLVYNELFNQGECLLLGGSCGEVLNSEYSQFATIPLSVWGLIHYLTLFSLAFRSHFESPRYFLSIFVLSFLGSIFSWYLLYLQAEVIESWCPLCLISFGINNLILLYMILLHFLHEKNERKSIDSKTFLTTCKTLLWNALVVLLIFKFSADHLKEEEQASDLKTIVGIIENDYIELNQVDPFIGEYIFLEKRKIDEFRKKFLRLKLIEKAAERANLALEDYLIEEKIIANREDFIEFLENYYLSSDEATEKLIEKLKKEFFYREIIY